MQPIESTIIIKTGATTTSKEKYTNAKYSDRKI